METFKKPLSASVDWKRINVVQTATAWDLIHTWPSNPEQYDEVFLYADNSADAAVVLSIEYWTATKPIEVSLAANSAWVLVTPWLILKWNSTPLTVKCFAATTAVVNIGWYVNRVAR